MRGLIVACLLIAPASWPGAGRAAPALKIYGSLPGFEQAAMSPSGDRIALIGAVKEQRSLIVLGVDQKPLLVTDVGEGTKIRSVDWAGEDRVLVWVSRTVSLGIEFAAAKTELSTVSVVPLDRGEPWSVFQGNDSIRGGVRGFYGTVQREGRWYGYFGGMTLERSMMTDESYLRDTSAELYEVDMIDGDSRRIARRREGDSSRDWLIGPDGKVAAMFDFLPNAGDWRLRDGEGKVIASGRNPRGGADLVALGRTAGTAIYGVHDEATEDVDWFEMPLAGGAPQEVLPDEAVLAIQVDSRSKQLIGYMRDGDQPEYRFFDARRQTVMQATRKAFPGSNVWLIDWNDAFDRLIVKTDGPGDAGTWWTVNIKTGAASELGRSYLVPAKDVGPVRTIEYKAADGLAMSGVLTLPPGREPRDLPVVVMPHGGPTSRDYPVFDWWAQAFAARGYAVFQPNFRGSTGYGPAFEQAGKGQWGRKMQTDISDGLAELAKQGIVDAKRACIVGASYGGYAALAGVTLQQGLYRCAVSVSGVSDVARMYTTEVRESGYNRTMIRSLKAEVGSGRDLRNISPITFADRADAPILLIHGKDDIVVLHSQSTAMANALRRAGKPVEFVTLAGEDHWLSKGETRLAMLEASVAFVERHNPVEAAGEK